MSTLTVADFRSQLAKYFDLVLAGEKVFIRRKTNSSPNQHQNENHERCILGPEGIQIEVTE